MPWLKRKIHLKEPIEDEEHWQEKTIEGHLHEGCIAANTSKLHWPSLPNIPFKHINECQFSIASCGTCHLFEPHRTQLFNPPWCSKSDRASHLKGVQLQTSYGSACQAMHSEGLGLGRLGRAFQLSALQPFNHWCTEPGTHRYFLSLGASLARDDAVPSFNAKGCWFTPLGCQQFCCWVLSLLQITQSDTLPTWIRSPHFCLAALLGVHAGEAQQTIAALELSTWCRCDTINIINWILSPTRIVWAQLGWVSPVDPLELAPNAVISGLAKKRLWRLETELLPDEQ